MTATASNGDEYDKEVERDYINVPKGGSDTLINNVTPPCHYEGDLTPPGVTQAVENVTGGSDKTDRGSVKVSPLRE